mmetsp:Transcript_44879/g.105811  ORF Transcript_44879/g.105811 Transcript_44879/m.105811 type:complete len:224 (-) Transcript_44879:339-1010(-)
MNKAFQKRSSLHFGGAWGKPKRSQGQDVGSRCGASLRPDVALLGRRKDGCRCWTAGDTALLGGGVEELGVDGDVNEGVLEEGQHSEYRVASQVGIQPCLVGDVRNVSGEIVFEVDDGENRDDAQCDSRWCDLGVDEEGHDGHEHHTVGGQDRSEDPPVGETLQHNVAETKRVWVSSKTLQPRHSIFPLNEHFILLIPKFVIELQRFEVPVVVFERHKRLVPSC